MGVGCIYLEFMNARARFQKLRDQIPVIVPAGMVLVVGALLSWGAASALSRQLADVGMERVVHQAELFAAALEQSVQSYGDIAQGMQAVFALDPELSRERFSTSWSGSSYQRHQGVRGVSFSRLVPTSEYLAFRERLEQEESPLPLVLGELKTAESSSEGSYLVVDYAWPGRNDALISRVDVDRQLAMRDVFRHVRNTREMQMSKPIQLQMGQASVTGLLVSTPVMREVAPEQSEFLGTINVSIEVAAILQSLRDKGVFPSAQFTVRDAGPTQPQYTDYAPAHDGMIYQTEAWGRSCFLPVFERTIHVMGRQWVLKFAPQRHVLSSLEKAYPWMVGAGGVALSLLAAAIVALITRQRQKALQLVASNARDLEYRTDRYRALFNQHAVGVAEIDPETGRYRHVNQRLCDILGYTPEELLALDIYQVTEEDERTECRRLVRSLSKGELSHYNVERRMVHKNGHTVWVEL